MKISLAQINTTVGDFPGNSARILEAYRRARSEGSDLVVFPELALAGYPPFDLLDRHDFLPACDRALAELAPRMDGPPAVVGTVRESKGGRRLHNTAAYVSQGRVKAWHDKLLLPTYDVFDEVRYFDPGESPAVIEVSGRKIGLSICEDLWNAGGTHPHYERDPGSLLRDRGAEILVCLSASPYHRSKWADRVAVFRAQAEATGLPVLVCNLVGGNTELLFDGGSFLVTQAGVQLRAPLFEEDLLHVDPDSSSPPPPLGGPGGSEELVEALVLGIRDFFHKCGFRRAILGLSGGVDSSLTAVLACEALGAESVRGVYLPTRYSSAGSRRDASRLAENLGLVWEEIDIDPLFQACLDTLQPSFGETPGGVAAENLQARIRGDLLMAISNQRRELLLSTSNKSELAVGYATLYGDMCGGLAPLGDLTKTRLYELARLPRFERFIPRSVLQKPPSAELRPDQTDQDTLPPYEVLDGILEASVEDRLGSEEIVARGHPRSRVEEVVTLVEASEYKRFQAAPILRVSPKAFGIGRRIPIAKRYAPARGEESDSDSDPSQD